MGLLDRATQIKRKAVIPKLKGKIEKEITQKPEKPRLFSEGELLETELDKILKIVRESKKITLFELEKRLNINPEKLEEYAKVLDDEGLLKFTYPIIGRSFLKSLEEGHENHASAKKQKYLKLGLFGLILLTLMVIVIIILRGKGVI
ncbi:hypothetical protein D6745_03925 [Candidatus Woesearchaeota archaeon]|nr:MAG: hypothetical protein D6745_03925 [Candidatus Woesearchaeota archaeon]